MFQGTYTAIVTPFENGNVDVDALRKTIDHQFANGITGVVPVGTTGESPTLSWEEHKRVIDLAVEFTAGRGQVIAGTGSNNLSEAVEITEYAEKAGCQGALVVAPYYNKPSQEGLFQHYRAIAESTSLPIMLYSIPGRCGIEIGVETTARLAQACPNIVCMKEAGGTPERVSQLLAVCPENFTVLSGDDSLTLPFMSVGAVGVVSVASNLVPGVMSELVRLALADKYAEARALHRKWYRLFSAFLKLDTNPVPIKTAMALKGLIKAGLRLPMVAMPEAKEAELAAVMKDLGLL